MRLIRARLRGFCQHLDTTLEFGERLTALKGPIGAGKSNAINGILYAFTGDLSRFPGVKADNICQGLGKREAAFVEVEFEHAGVRATLWRGLRPSGQLLTVAGRERTWDKDREIKAELEAILGVSEKILTDYVFVEQWKVFDFLLRTDAETAQTFAQLFGLERARLIYDLLGVAPVEVPAAAVDVDVVRQRIAQRERELAEVAQELERYDDDLPASWPERDDPDSRVLENWLAKEQLQNEHDNLCAVRVMLLEEVTQTQPVHRDAEDRLVAARIISDTLETELAGVQRDYTLWDVHDRYLREKTYADVGLAAAQAELATLQAPDRPAFYVSEDDSSWRAVMHQTEVRLGQLRRFLETFDPERGVGDCPTCLTPGAALTVRHEEFSAEATELEHTLFGWKRVWEASRCYDRNLAHYERRVASAQANIQSFTRQLASLEAAEAPSRSKEELAAWMARKGVHDRACRQLEQEVQETGNHAAAVFARWEKCLVDITALTVRIGELHVTREDFHAADSRLRERRQAWRTCTQLRAQHAALTAALGDERLSLTRAEDALRLQARARRVRDHLDAVRSRFHHDGLPRLVSQGYLESMQGDINRVLEDFDAPFRVVEICNLRFLMRKGDVVLPATRLSGGEKVLFAIAFRIVVNALFASELGLLCLDEPTAGLDEDSVDLSLVVALGRLRSLSEARGLQVVLITHERGLDRLFDHVIDLGSREGVS